MGEIHLTQGGIEPTQEGIPARSGQPARLISLALSGGVGPYGDPALDYNTGSAGGRLYDDSTTI